MERALTTVGINASLSFQEYLVISLVNKILILNPSLKTVYKTISLTSKEDYIISLETNFKQTSLGYITNLKQLVILDFNLEPMFTKTCVKRPISLTFSSDGNQFLVGDKFGDVYHYTRTSEPSEVHEPILGHVSVLTDVKFSADDKYVITADRDEKVRVTHYPNAYNIHGYCLKHTAFVTKVSSLPTHPDWLVSGGGDGWLNLFQVSTCTLLHGFDFAQVEGVVVDEKLVVSQLLPIEKKDLVLVGLENQNYFLILQVQDEKFQLVSKVDLVEPNLTGSITSLAWHNPLQLVYLTTALGNLLEYSFQTKQLVTSELDLLVRNELIPLQSLPQLQLLHGLRKVLNGKEEEEEEEEENEDVEQEKTKKKNKNKK